MDIKAEGIVNISSNGEWLDVFYPNIEFGNKKINNEIVSIIIDESFNSNILFLLILLSKILI